MGLEVRIPWITYKGGGKIKDYNLGNWWTWKGLVLLMVVLAIWVEKCPHINSKNHGHDFNKVGLGSVL